MVMPYKWKVHMCEVSEEQIITEFNYMITFRFASMLMVKGGMKKKCDKTYSQTSSESLQSLVAHVEIAPTISNNYLKCPLNHCADH